MAVNVTIVPAHTGLAEAVIVTLTGNTGFTVIVMVLELAGLPVGHMALEVKEHLMVLPFDGIKV